MKTPPHNATKRTRQTDATASALPALDAAGGRDGDRDQRDDRMIAMVFEMRPRIASPAGRYGGRDRRVSARTGPARKFSQTPTGENPSVISRDDCVRLFGGGLNSPAGVRAGVWSSRMSKAVKAAQKTAVDAVLRVVPQKSGNLKIAIQLDREAALAFAAMLLVASSQE